LNIRDSGFTNHAGLHGSCQFSGCTELADGTNLLGDPREATASRNTFRIGDADSEQLGLTVNTGYEIGDGELYGFITYSKRENESAAFFHHNNNTGGNAPLQDGDATIQAGFLPKINSDIKDISYNFGYQAEFDNGSSLNFSYTYDQNNIDYTTSNTINSSFANLLQYNADGSLAEITADRIRSAVPREASAYDLELALSTLNLNYAQDFDLFSLAVGAEICTDTYKVTPGAEYSYRDYDMVNGDSLFITDASAGTQGFGGIGPVSAIDESRDVISFYVDAKTEMTEDLIISGAVRCDDYDGFGDSSNFKLAAN
jgi:iron complex outermembrane receptor protein